jgi:hypothetical protein
VKNKNKSIIVDIKKKKKKKRKLLNNNNKKKKQADLNTKCIIKKKLMEIILRSK